LTVLYLKSPGRATVINEKIPLLFTLESGDGSVMPASLNRSGVLHLRLLTDWKSHNFDGVASLKTQKGQPISEQMAKATPPVG
jgi:hypothetical protein